jgi:hypothetical protein
MPGDHANPNFIVSLCHKFLLHINADARPRCNITIKDRVDCNCNGRIADCFKNSGKGQAYLVRMCEMTMSRTGVVQYYIA